MHVLWVSDSPDTPSGFGNVTRYVCEGLAMRGHRVSILGWQTREVSDWKGCKLYPTQTDKLGGDALFPLLVRIRPEVVISLADVWWLPYFTAPHVRRQMELTDAPWLLYFPIDGDIGDDRLPTSWIQMLQQVDLPVAMSRYGQQVARKCGITCEYIPHGVDLSVFFPPPEREAAKQRFGNQGKFVVLSDSRNQPRKMLPRLLDVFACFAEGRADVVLHLHTDVADEFTRSLVNSYNVQRDVEFLGLADKVRFTPGFVMKKGGGLPLAELATYYQAADVHLLASSGEGFGLPTLQAAATGAVPMACDYSASKELTEGHGDPLPVAEWTANEFGIRRALIDIDEAAARLARYYDDRDFLRAQSQKSAKFAAAYDWHEVVNQWDLLLRSLAGSKRRLRQTAPAHPKAIERFVPELGRKGSGVSVSVKMIDREFGRMEASILADVRGRCSDVCIPAAPLPCKVAMVQVPRRPGYVGLTFGSTAAFQQLRSLFPIVHGWTLPQVETSLTVDGVKQLASSAHEDARYELAQSILLLNCDGEMPETVLIEAALFGVPCVGNVKCELQEILWPELAIGDQQRAAVLARALFTNAARVHRIAAEARELCLERFAPGEMQIAASLKRLHAQQTRPAGIIGA